MASGSGWIHNYYTVYDHERHIKWITRQLYWIRYLDWFITTPLTLRALTVLAGLSSAEIFFTIIFDMAMVFCVRTSLLAHSANDY